MLIEKINNSANIKRVLLNLYEVIQVNKQF